MLCTLTDMHYLIHEKPKEIAKEFKVRKLIYII